METSANNLGSGQQMEKIDAIYERVRARAHPNLPRRERETELTAYEIRIRLNL